MTVTQEYFQGGWRNLGTDSKMKKILLMDESREESLCKLGPVSRSGLETPIWNWEKGVKCMA
jgi:hypothetical protein